MPYITSTKGGYTYLEDIMLHKCVINAYFGCIALTC